MCRRIGHVGLGHQSEFDQLMNQGSTSGELTVLQSSVTLGASTAITMRCVLSTGTADVSRRTITAYKLSTLTVQ